MNRQLRVADRLDERSVAGLLVFLGLWTVIAVVAATTSYIALGRSTLGQWLTIFGYMASYFYAWAVISFAIHWLTRSAEKAGMRWFVQLPLHLLLLVAVATALPFLIQPDQWRVWLYGERAIGFHSLNAFVYSFVLVGSLMLSYYRLSRAREAEARDARMRQLELERSLDKSRIEALRAQINPHFLFNTLNSIASLVEAGSNREAYQVIELLAALLRNALDFSRGDRVTLEEELDFLDAYLAIEDVRFAGRLRVERSIPEDCLELEVPALSLQPLLENVIKHAVSAGTEPVTVRLGVTRRRGTLTLEVADDGPGLPEPLVAGVGLSNVRDRLRYLYGESARFESFNNAAGGATFRLVFPARADAGAAGIPLARKTDRPQERDLHPATP